MEAKQVKLHYMNIRGLGEIARLLFAFSGTEFEDVRYEETGDWLKHKTSMPLQQVPVLELDGVQHPQSLAIWSYLAKVFGLYPATPKDQMTVDQVGLTLLDMVNFVRTYFEVEDPEKKQKLIEAARSDSKKFLDFLEKLLSGSGTGYFVEGRLTLADIILFDVLTGLTRQQVGPLDTAGHVKDLKDKFPWMAKCHDNVLANDRIAAYVKARKDSEY